MSSEALAWAFRQNVKSSSVKFTLVALCECANYRTGRITPSIEHLVEITGQNRKTIIANVAELERLGLIVDTGERTGRTKQIKVYNPVFGTVPQSEQSQERNSSVSGRKQSQKRDTEPSLEPSHSTEPKGSSECKARKPGGRMTALPDGWQPVLTVAAQSMVDGWPPGMFEAELEKFRDHAADKGRTSKDWQAAFRTWIKNANNWKPVHERQSAAPYGSTGRAGHDRRSSLARAIDDGLEWLDGGTQAQVS